jgi:hypothetical protein
MKSLRFRRLIIAFVIALPVIALAGLSFYRIVLRPDRNPVTAAQPLADATLADCESAASLAAYHAQPAQGGAAISADDALKRADDVLAQQYQQPDGTPLSGTSAGAPRLVQATIGGQQRLAWLTVMLLDNETTASSGASLGKAAVIYLDAQTGDPLAVITDVAVSSLSSCGTPRFSLTSRQILPLALLGAYVALVIIVGATVWLRKRKRAAISGQHPNGTLGTTRRR